MLISRTGPGATTADDVTYEEKIWTFWQANGTIAVGAPVVHDVSTDSNAFNQNSLLVVEGNCNSNGAEQRILGSYQGHIAAKLGAGGYSTENVAGLTTDGSTTITTTVLSGYAAFSSDVIRILSYGQGYALCHGGTTDINQGDILTIVEVGRYTAGTEETGGAGAQVWAQGTHTGAFEAGCSVFHRCL